MVQTKWEVLPGLEYAECLELVHVHDEIRGDYYRTRYVPAHQWQEMDRQIH